MPRKPNRNGKWRAEIGVNRKTIYLGLFDKDDEEAAALKKAAKAANTAFDDGKPESEAKDVVLKSLEESMGPEKSKKLAKIFFEPDFQGEGAKDEADGRDDVLGSSLRINVVATKS